MKFKVVLLGLLAALAGVFPILDLLGVMKSPIPTSGWGYAVIVIAIGIIDLLYTIVAHIDLIGTSQHIITALLAVGLIAAGLLPFLKNSLPAGVPTDGIIYFAIVAVIGVIEMFYGFSLLRYG